MIKKLLINDIIEYLNDLSQVRVLYLNTESDLCITIKMNTKRLDIRFESFKAMEELLDNQKIRLITKDLTCRFIFENELSVAQKKILDERWEIVEYLFSKNTEPQIYLKKSRASIINEACYRFNKKKRVVYEYFRLYLQGGKRKLALIPKYDKCGASGKEKTSTTCKLGRPNAYMEINTTYGGSYPEEYRGINIDETAKNNIFTSIQRYRKNNPDVSISKAMELMKLDYYSVADEWGNVTELPPHLIPTPRQFYYWNQKLRNLDFERYEINTKGQKYFNLNSRALTSNTKYKTFGPGYRYEIDATKPNIHLLNRLRTEAIGTPVIYYVVDTFCPKIVGLHVGLGAPSWDGASSALYNIIENKVEFAKKYGLEISEKDWPNSPMPKLLLADRGSEFVGTLPEHAIKNLEITLDNTPSGRGDYKPNVEKAFNITEEKMKGLIPGFSASKYRQRGEVDPNSMAKFTLDEITRVYILLAINYNHREMKNYPVTEEMINDGVKLTPEAIWEWGWENYSGEPTRWDEDFVKFSLFRRDTASVTERGIEFLGLCYLSEKAISQGWLSKARALGVWHVEIAFDQRNMNQISLVNRLDQNLDEVCHLTKEYSAFSNKSYDEIQLYKLGKTVNHLNLREEQNQNNADLFIGLRGEVKEANSKYKGINGKAKPTASKIRENRAEENKSIRTEQALVIGKDTFTTEEMVHKTEESKESKKSRMFARIRQAKGGD